MSRASAAYLSRPSLLDFFLLVVGCALSFFLARLPLPFFQEPVTGPVPVDHGVREVLPSLLQLPDGVILLWPFFYLIQLGLGRSRGMTAGEWLWLFAWLGNALLHTLALVVELMALPEFLRTTTASLAPYSVYWTYWPAIIWYMVLLPSMALIAVIIAVVGAFSREPPPWTNNLGLVLIIWPLLPLAGILAAAKWA
jgi:hypothetical protein